MAKRIQCKGCGKYGLKWQLTSYGWRLVWPNTGRVHFCKRSSSSAGVPVGITAVTEEVTTDGKRRHPGSAKTTTNDRYCVLRVTGNVNAMDAGRTAVECNKASSLRTHLSPGYASKPRMRLARFSGIGDYSYLCTLVVDGVRFGGMGYRPEDAYARMLARQIEFERRPIADVKQPLFGKGAWFCLGFMLVGFVLFAASVIG